MAKVPARSRNPTGASKYSTGLAERGAQMVAKGHTLAEVAEALGVHLDTIFRWLRKYEDFRQLVDDAYKVSAIALDDKALQLAQRIAQPGVKQTDARNASYTLLHYRWACAKRDPRRFGERHERAQGGMTITINTNLALDGAEPGEDGGRTLSGTYAALAPEALPAPDPDDEPMSAPAPGRRAKAEARYVTEEVDE